MKTLYFLFDVQSAFCQRSRLWLQKQPAYLKIEAWPAQSPETRRRFPGAVKGLADEIVVVSDEGGVYRGDEAAIMCLYALRRYRAWARRMARPENLPLAQHGLGLLVSGAVDLSKWFGPEASCARRAVSSEVPYAQFANVPP